MLCDCIRDVMDVEFHVVSDSESILNGTLDAKLNRLYQCQSKIVFITILGDCFTTYPGRGIVL